MAFRDLDEYEKYVRKTIAASGVAREREWNRISVQKKAKNKGSVSVLKMKLSNGAIFSFTEDVVIENREVVRQYYSYKYVSESYQFRYDKDPDTTVAFSHAECHLHANSEEPRYITHETSFEEILQFIKACFCGDK